MKNTGPGVTTAHGPSTYVTVPRGLLELCDGLLAECDKHMPVTGSNFDGDMALARAQLREHLK